MIPARNSCKNPVVAHRPSATSSKKKNGGLRSLLPHDSFVIKLINPLLSHVLNLCGCFNTALVHKVITC